MARLYGGHGGHLSRTEVQMEEDRGEKGNRKRGQSQRVFRAVVSGCLLAGENGNNWRVIKKVTEGKARLSDVIEK